jgi:hypothetical protein
MSLISLARGMFREVIDRSVTVSNRSDTVIHRLYTYNMVDDEHENTDSAMSGSHFTTFLPSMESNSDLSDFHPTHGAGTLPASFCTAFSPSGSKVTVASHVAGALQKGGIKIYSFSSLRTNVRTQCSTRTSAARVLCKSRTGGRASRMHAPKRP